jgi:hypothetical protein
MGLPGVLQGPRVRLFRTRVSLGGELEIITGVMDPTQDAVEASRGSLYLRSGGAGGNLYVKRDDGFTTNWILIPIGVSGGTVDVVELTSPHVENKQIILSSAPADPTKAVVNFSGGCLQKYEVDFIITGDVLSWSGRGMETVASVGDTVTIQYQLN